MPENCPAGPACPACHNPVHYTFPPIARLGLHPGARVQVRFRVRVAHSGSRTRTGLPVSWPERPMPSHRDGHAPCTVSPSHSESVLVLASRPDACRVDQLSPRHKQYNWFQRRAAIRVATLAGSLRAPPPHPRHYPSPLRTRPPSESEPLPLPCRCTRPAKFKSAGLTARSGETAPFGVDARKRHADSDGDSDRVCDGESE